MRYIEPWPFWCVVVRRVVSWVKNWSLLDCCDETVAEGDTSSCERCSGIFTKVLSSLNLRRGGSRMSTVAGACDA